MIFPRAAGNAGAVLLCLMYVICEQIFAKPGTPAVRDTQSAKDTLVAVPPVSAEDWAVYLDAYRLKLQQEGFSELLFVDRTGAGCTGKFTIPRPAECAVIVIGTDPGLTATIKQPDGSSGALGTLEARGDVYSIFASNRAISGEYRVDAKNASGKSGRFALLAGIKNVSGTDDWSVIKDVVLGEFGKNGYTVIIDTTAMTSGLSKRYSLTGPAEGLFMGWAVVSNNNSIEVTVSAPDGRTTPLGGGTPSSGFFINMNFVPAKPGDYILKAQTSGGRADKIMMVIGSRPRN